MIKRIVQIIGGLVFLVIAFYLTNLGVIKNEVNQCHKYNQQFKEYSHFWITKSDKAMCDYRGIEVTAPIRIERGEKNLTNGQWYFIEGVGSFQFTLLIPE